MAMAVLTLAQHRLKIDGCYQKKRAEAPLWSQFLHTPERYLKPHILL